MMYGVELVLWRLGQELKIFTHKREAFFASGLLLVVMVKHISILIFSSQLFSLCNQLDEVESVEIMKLILVIEVIILRQEH